MKKKILYIGRYSTPYVRERMKLYSLKPLNLIRRIMHRPLTSYTNSAVWHSDYIKELNKCSDKYEIHVASPAQGMINEFQEMVIDSVTYHFYSVGSFYFNKLKEKQYQANGHKKFRERFIKIYNEVQPDIIIQCGAENPIYSYGILDVEDTPVILILQTLLNSKKRKAMNVGGKYRRDKEIEVFKRVNYFCTTGTEEAQFINSINPSATIAPIKFITHTPTIYNCEKKFDFVFFASVLSRNKGLDDAINALGIVVKTHPNVTLNIIGGFSSVDYKNSIIRLISELGMKNNVVISGRYPNVEDVYRSVQEARVVLSPGITAFNSTVRESMLMCQPVIVYRLPMVDDINSESQCLVVAEMEDNEDLAKKMLFALNNPEEMNQFARKGKVYADAHFGEKEIGDSLVALVDNILGGSYEN